MPGVAQQKYRTGMRWLLGSGAIAIVSIGGYFAYVAWAGASAQGVTVQIVTVERGDVVKTVSAGGVVQVGNQQTLEAPTTADNTAVVERIEVQVNSAIAADQVLVRLRNAAGLAQIERKRLETEKQRLQVEQQQRAVEKAALALAKAERTYRTEQTNEAGVREAAIRLAQAQIELAKQQATLPRLQEELATVTALEAQGYVATNELRTAQDSLRDARAELERLEQEVEQAELSLAQARLTERQQLVDARDEQQTKQLELQDARQGVATTLQDLEDLTVQLASAEDEFADSSLIRATTAGRVLAIHTAVGEVIQQGDRLLTIGDPGREEVELQLTTLQAALVKANQPATVTAIGLVEGTFPARVERIDRVASVQAEQDFFGGGDTGRVQAVVVLNQPSGTLIPGGQVSIEIEVDAARDVLQVPPQFVQGQGDAAFVWVVDDAGRVAQRPVEVGLVGDTATEIQSGLTEGEQIASPPPEVTLTEGMSVTPESLDSPPAEVSP